LKVKRDREAEEKGGKNINEIGLSYGIEIGIF